MANGLYNSDLPMAELDLCDISDCYILMHGDCLETAGEEQHQALEFAASYRLKMQTPRGFMGIVQTIEGFCPITGGSDMSGYKYPRRTPWKPCGVTRMDVRPSGPIQCASPRNGDILLIWNSVTRSPNTPHISFQLVLNISTSRRVRKAILKDSNNAAEGVNILKSCVL